MKTSPAVSWVFPLSERSPVRNLWSVSDVPAPHSSPPQEPRARLPTLAGKRLMTNRCWFMCCWLSCLPSRQMCCRNRALSRWDLCPSCTMWATDDMLYMFQSPGSGFLACCGLILFNLVVLKAHLSFKSNLDSNSDPRFAVACCTETLI